MIGKVFKLEYRKDCGELLQFLCICQIWYQNTGDSFNSPSQGFWYHHLSQFKFMRMSSCNKQYKNALSFCIFFPQYILKWLKKKQYSLGLGFFFWWWKWEKETEDDSSKPVNRSGLSPQWNFRAHTPVCSLSNIVTQKSMLTLTESTLEWKGKLLKCLLV